MRPNLNIVHSVASLALNTGGPSYVVSALAGAQAQLIDGAVHVVYRKDGMQPIATTDQVQAHPVEKRWPANLFATRSLLHDLARGEATVLHDQGIWHSQNIAASGFAAARALPYVISTHGMLEPWALAYRPIKKQLARWLYQNALLRKASCLMATSAREYQSLRNLKLSNPIAVIPNGIDTDIPALARKEAPLPRTALFLSRLHPVKGIVHAIEAWHALRPAHWRLRIVGPSEIGHREELEALVRQYRLTEHISFSGPVSGVEKFQCYRDADVFLLPSHTENFGIAVAESLACGLPAITTVGTPWSQLPHKGCGWCIPIGTQALVETLREVFRMPSTELQAMGERGREWVTQEFRWEAIAAQNVAVYDWVLGRRAKPDFVDL